MPGTLHNAANRPASLRTTHCSTSQHHRPPPPMCSAVPVPGTVTSSVRQRPGASQAPGAPSAWCKRPAPPPATRQLPEMMPPPRLQERDGANSRTGAVPSLWCGVGGTTAWPGNRACSPPNVRTAGGGAPGTQVFPNLPLSPRRGNNSSARSTPP
jgi:hypothetical protein